MTEKNNKPDIPRDILTVLMLLPFIIIAEFALFIIMVAYRDITIPVTQGIGCLMSAYMGYRAVKINNKELAQYSFMGFLLFASAPKVVQLLLQVVSSF